MRNFHYKGLFSFCRGQDSSSSTRAKDHRNQQQMSPSRCVQIAFICKLSKDNLSWQDWESNPCCCSLKLNHCINVDQDKQRPSQQCSGDMHFIKDDPLQYDKTYGSYSFCGNTDDDFILKPQQIEFLHDVFLKLPGLVWKYIKALIHQLCWLQL